MKELTTVQPAAFSSQVAGSVVVTSCVPPGTSATPRPLRAVAQRPRRGSAGVTFPVLSDIQGSIPLLVISDRVVREFRLRPDDLQSRTRDQRITFARQLARFLCRRITDPPFETIGEHFKRDHSTVIHAVNLIERRMVRDTAFRPFIEKLEGQITGTIPATTAAAA